MLLIRFFDLFKFILMNKFEEVSQLINSLSIPEKKYFKQYTSRFRENANRHCIVLFNIMNKPKMHEKNVLELLPEDTFRHFHVYLNQLNDLLLNSLQSFTKRSVDEEISNLISKAVLLNSRNLFFSAIKTVRKARKIAHKYEKFRLMLSIIDLERKIYETRQFNETTEQELDILHQEEVMCLNRLQAESHLIKKNNELLFLFRTRGAARDGREQEVYHKIADSLDYTHENLSFRSKLVFQAFYINYYRAIQDGEKAYALLKKDVFMDKPHMISEFPRSYVNKFTATMSVCLNMKKYDKLFEVIRNCERELESKKNILPAALQFFAKLNIVLHRFVALIHTARFMEARLEIPEVELLLKDERTGPFFKMQLYFLNAFLHFINGDYGHALKLLLNIRDNIKTRLYQQISSTSRMLMLIIYYEKGDIDLLYYEVRSAYRYLVRIQNLYLFEKLLLDFIRLKIRHISNRQAELVAFRELKNELILVADNPLERQFLYYFDVISWLESKIENRPFGQVLHEKAASSFAG